MREQGHWSLHNKEQWIKARHLIEEQLTVNALGANQPAKLWVGWMALTEERRTELRLTGYYDLVRQDVSRARFYSHFIAPLNEAFGAPSEKDMAIRSLNERHMSQTEKENYQSWWIRILAVASKAYGNEAYWQEEVWRAIADLFISRALHPGTLNRFVDPEILEKGSLSDKMKHIKRLDTQLGGNQGSRIPHHPLANGVSHKGVESQGRQQEGGANEKNPQNSATNPKWQGSKKFSNNGGNSSRPSSKPNNSSAMDVNWLKRDGNCSRCNRNDPHEQPCDRPRVCWTCGSGEHVRRECPKAQKGQKEGGVQYCPPPREY